MTFDTNNERPRKMGAMEALLWNLECIQDDLSVVDGMSKFADWNQREHLENIKDVMRRNYELALPDKLKQTLYAEPGRGAGRILDHAIPLSQWVHLCLAAPRQFQEAIYFMAWCGPVANISAASNMRLSLSAEAFNNYNPLHPFARYSRAGIKVLHGVDGESVSGQPLYQHYEQLEMMPYMRPVMAYAREHLALDEALVWLEDRLQPVQAMAA